MNRWEERKAIAKACFLGGFSGTAIAILASPSLWWLGLLAGFAAGYVSYRFMDVVSAVPMAARFAAGGLWEALCASWHWLMKSHPLLYTYIIMVAAFELAAVYVFVAKVIPSYAAKDENFARMIVSYVFLVNLMTCFFVTLSIMVLVIYFGSGLRERHGFWEFCDLLLDNEQVNVGFWKMQLWVLKGLFIVLILIPLKFFLWEVWRFLAIFFWKLFKLVHSSERVLCGVDSALGTFAACVWFWNPNLGPEGNLLVVFSGGIFGVLFGVLNYELISVRLLKVVKART